MTLQSRTILFSALTLLITISMTGINNVWAIDHTYYLAQYERVDKEITKLDDDVRNLEKEIESLKDSDPQQIQLKNLLAEKQGKIAELIKETDRIQEQSRALFKVDPETEKKMYAAEKILRDEYLNKDSSTYVGKNPVGDILVDLEHKQILIWVDSDKLLKQEFGSNYVASMLSDMRKDVKDIPIKAQLAKFELIACNARTDPCSPRIGGISVAKQGDPASASSTLAYRSKDSLGNVGFVLAGHAVLGPNVNVAQPGGGSVVARVNSEYCKQANVCDFAFAKANAGITVDNTIFKDPGTTYSIALRQTDNFQPVGTIVKKSGLTTFITTGTVTFNSPGSNHNTVQIHSDVGDSGSPVFRLVGTSGAELYGMMFNKVIVDGVEYSQYYPQDYIKSRLGLTE